MKRKAIPEEIRARVLYDANRTCCMCRHGNRRVQIHHVDGDHTNNDLDNLAVLCREHHGEVSAREPFTASLSTHEVRMYRDTWRAHVKECRRAGRPVVDHPAPPPPAAAANGPRITIDNSPRTETNVHVSTRHWQLVVGVTVSIAVVAGLTMLRGAASEPSIQLPPDLRRTPVVTDAGPRDLRAEDRGELVRLTWAPAGDATVGYLLAYAAENGRTEQIGIDRDRTEQTVTRLDPATPYCFRLWAILVQPDGSQGKAAADVGVRGCELEPPAENSS